MAEVQLHHWKSLVCDSRFIGEGDFAPGEEKVLTIDHVESNVSVVNAEGKSAKAVVYWKEPGNKPMILNNARSNAIEKVSGSGYVEKWPGTRVQLYIEHGIKAFGDVVNAVRVRPYKPRIRPSAPAPVCADCKQEVKPSMGKDAQWLAEYTHSKYGAVLCADCAKLRAQKAAEPEESKEPEQVSIEQDSDGAELENSDLIGGDFL